MLSENSGKLMSIKVMFNYTLHLFDYKFDFKLQLFEKFFNYFNEKYYLIIYTTEEFVWNKI